MKISPQTRTWSELREPFLNFDAPSNMYTKLLRKTIANAKQVQKINEDSKKLTLKILSVENNM